MTIKPIIEICHPYWAHSPTGKSSCAATVTIASIQQVCKKGDFLSPLCLYSEEKGALVKVRFRSIKVIKYVKPVDLVCSLKGEIFHKNRSSENPSDIQWNNIKLLRTTSWQQMPLSCYPTIPTVRDSASLTCPSVLVRNFSSLILRSALLFFVLLSYPVEFLQVRVLERDGKSEESVMDSCRQTQSMPNFFEH